MTINYDNLGIRIAQRRRELKMKQYVLAEKTGLSNNHISNVENGHTIPSLEALAKICEALNVTPDYLLLGNIKTNDIPKNIYDNLLLCNKNSLKLISKLVEVILTNQE
jgi:transcriptional regulator with XRE-family HTH domain